ncbi:hypothetical protein TNCV_2289541 [Trichonephila clavipes]|uniref:Tc1-like transposase DDE domain-containing protein n=1 Tax=Trichonephila clavipes TaxID=2585209 RepID=A0A8X6RNZ0_TRICX|nr:hypothetical protein TNCV_2289541 [Trichonephila clavipes]
MQALSTRRAIGMKSWKPITRIVDEFDEGMDISRIVQPLRSPDLNPMEHICDGLGKVPPAREIEMGIHHIPKLDQRHSTVMVKNYSLDQPPAREIEMGIHHIPKWPRRHSTLMVKNYSLDQV